MANRTEDRLLREFGGLFDGETTGMDSLATGDSGVTQSITETITQFGQAVAGLASNRVVAQSRLSTPGSNEEAVGASGSTRSLSERIDELGQMAASSPANVAANPAGTNTRGGSTPTANSGDAGSSVESIATTFLESGFGIVPLITSLVGLFEGGSDTPPPLQHYIMPSAISFDSADTGGTLTAADFDQTGAPRMYGAPSGDNGASGAGTGPNSGDTTSGGAAATPQITVNVQAMDAQSFMDYSSQIAQAVRGAMLNLSSLNDVVNEL